MYAFQSYSQAKHVIDVIGP